MSLSPWGESPSMKWVMAIESADPWWFVRQDGELEYAGVSRNSSEWRY